MFKSENQDKLQEDSRDDKRIKEKMKLEITRKATAAWKKVRVKASLDEMPVKRPDPFDCSRFKHIPRISVINN